MNGTLSLADALNRALGLYQAGHFDKAEAVCNAILRAKADHFDARHLLAILQSRLERFQEALANYDQALTIKPDHPDALNNRGNALLGLKRFDEALASYDKALAIKPDHANALSNRGNALLEAFRRGVGELRQGAGDRAQSSLRVFRISQLSAQTL